MRLYSLISIMHAQFVTPTPIKKPKQSYKLFKKSVCFCLQLDNKVHVGITQFKQINDLLLIIDLDNVSLQTCLDKPQQEILI